MTERASDERLAEMLKAVKPVAWMKPAHPAVVEPRFILASEMVHDWQRTVFTIPLYATPQHGSEP